MVSVWSWKTHRDELYDSDWWLCGNSTTNISTTLKFQLEKQSLGESTNKQVGK